MNRGVVPCSHAVRTDRIRDGGSRYCPATCRSVRAIDGSDSVLNKLLVAVQRSQSDQSIVKLLFSFNDGVLNVFAILLISFSF